MRINFTTVGLKNLPFAERGQQKIRDAQLPGFGVIVGKRSKTFFVMTGKDRKTITIGKFGEISLADARKEAMRVLSQDQPKIVPQSLSEARTAYLADCQAKNKPSTIVEYERMLSLLPDKPLSNITRHDMPNPTSHRIMAARIFFNWCIKHELVDRNPFNHLPTKVGERNRVLSDDELKAIWQYEYEPFSTIVKLLILTGQRRAQIWKLQPEWIDGDLVTFPGEIMKGNRPHTIPLGPFAQELAAKAPFQFTSWTKGKKRIDKHTGVTGWTIHDIRRCHSTLAARIGIPIHVEEKILDHRTGTISGVSAIYNRHSYIEEMRTAVLQLENHLASIISP